MSNRSIGLDDQTYDYLLEVSLRESAVCRRLREETAGMTQSNMQIAPEQGQFMALVARMIGAERFLEVGTFTGYSALVVALVLPDHGRVEALDISEEWTAIARRYWREAGVEDRISLRLNPAIDTLNELVDEGRSGTFDLAFIDADKTGYVDYFEACMELVRPGGVIMIDNTLWDGAVADPATRDTDTEAIRRFNRHVHNDSRIDLSLVPIGDGLTMARKKGRRA